MSTLLTLDFFSKKISDRECEIKKIVQDSKHIEYNNLLKDLENLNKNELYPFIEKNHLETFVGNEHDMRVEYLKALLDKKIAIERLNKISEQNLPLKPYDSTNLSGINISENNLVSIDQFKLDKRTGFRYNNHVYILCPTLPQITSNRWLSEEIVSCYTEYGIRFKIRLDPFVEKTTMEFDNEYIMKKAQSFGKQKLDWERIKNLREKELVEYYECNSDLEKTQLVWSPRTEDKTDKIHFICEELPKESAIHYQGSRYFHTIFDKQTGDIEHCDGAIRIYTEEELGKRTKYHIANEVNKIGKRIKIFQFDSNENQNIKMNKELFSKLVVCFFHSNNDIDNYFKLSV